MQLFGITTQTAHNLSTIRAGPELVDEVLAGTPLDEARGVLLHYADEDQPQAARHDNHRFPPELTGFAAAAASAPDRWHNLPLLAPRVRRPQAPTSLIPPRPYRVWLPVPAFCTLSILHRTTHTQRLTPDAFKTLRFTSHTVKHIVHHMHPASHVIH